MKAGFAKTDITPRVGVELAGFGPFLHRYSKDVRDPLYSRAMAVSDGDDSLLVVSNDIIGLNPEIVSRARELIQDQTGIPPECCMLHATHTHSGPGIRESFSGWGEPDPPYVEQLPHKIAKACTEAVENLEDASFSLASVPAAHIGYNRELQDMPVYEETLKDDWEPEQPDKTDLTAYMLAVTQGEGMAGFISSYSCHPVVCCQKTHSIHGDYAGVATNAIEQEQGGAVGLFLQGALGDINSCVVHTDQERSMKGLDVISKRYADIIRKGLEECSPLTGEGIACAMKYRSFSCKDWSEEYLEGLIEKFASEIKECTNDEDYDCRMNMVKMIGTKKMLARKQQNLPPDTGADLQAFRIGDLYILGLPFETFFGIKQRIARETGLENLLVLSTTNGYIGYAPTKEHFLQAQEKGGTYSDSVVPFIAGRLPYTEDLEDEIVETGLVLLKKVQPK